MIELKILFNPKTNEVSVNGPIQNRMLCYAMLKVAEKAVDENYAREIERAKTSVIPVHSNGKDLISHLRGR